MAELELDDELEEGTSTMRDLRNHAKALERKLKQAEKELEDLRGYRESVETEKKFTESNKIFESLGFSSKHADLFRAVNPDVIPDEEAIKEFATAYDIQLFEKDDDVAPAADPLVRDVPFKPVSSGQPTGRKRYDGVEWWDFYRENPGAALLAVKEGRVDLLTELPK